MSREYSILFKPSARKELFSLPDQAISAIEEKIDVLISNPRPHGCKKLSGSINEYRIRIGNYRVVYTVSDDTLIVYVIKIAHRKNVYK